MSDDPVRLLDDAGVESKLREALASAKNAPAPTLDTTAGLARLNAAIVSDGGGPPDSPPTDGGAGGAAQGGVGGAAQGAAVGKSSAGAWIVGTALAGTLAVGGALLLRKPPPVKNQPPPAAQPAAKAPAKPVPSAAKPETVSEPPPPEPIASAKPRPRVAPSAATNKPDAKESKKDRIKREVAQLAAARAALGSNPAKALALAEAGHREFARGLLYQEREAIAVLALSRMGSSAAARSRGQAFLSRFPKGPASDSVRSAIGQPEEK